MIEVTGRALGNNNVGHGPEFTHNRFKTLPELKVAACSPLRKHVVKFCINLNHSSLIILCSTNECLFRFIL